MHVSVNKCELLAEQIISGVSYNRAKFNPDDFKLSNGIENEYNFLQDFYRSMKRMLICIDEWNEDCDYFYYEMIAYMLWYDINVKNNSSDSIDYARQVVTHKWKESEKEEIPYV